MRVFIGINLDHQEFFTSLQEQINHDQVQCNYSKQFHLTIRFLGEISEQQCKNLIGDLNKITFNQFKLYADKIGVFPSEKKIGIIWIGLKENKELTNLAKEIHKATKKITTKGGKKFHPHITLARVKQIPQDLKQEYIKQLKSIKPQQQTFTINQFKLIKSTLTPDGAVYTDLAVFDAKEQNLFKQPKNPK